MKAHKIRIFLPAGDQASAYVGEVSSAECRIPKSLDCFLWISTFTAVKSARVMSNLLRATLCSLSSRVRAERDMGTEGAGSADTAVRDAINQGLILGPRLRISGNAVDILGGHEDANRFNPAQQVLSNATYANGTDEIVAAIRQQHKEGSDFVKMYETGPDSMSDGILQLPYRYPVAQPKARVQDNERFGGTA